MVLTACPACTARRLTEAASHTLVGVVAPSGSVSPTSCQPLQAAQPPCKEPVQQLITSLCSVRRQTHLLIRLTHLLSPTHSRQDPNQSATVSQACIHNRMGATAVCSPHTAWPPADPQAIIGLPARQVKLVRIMAH